MMTLEEVWENLRQDTEIKATMEEAEKGYKLFKKIENLIVADLEAKLAEYKSKVRVAFSQLASFQLRYDDLKKEYKEQEDLLEKTLANNSKLQLELDQLKQQLEETEEQNKKLAEHSQSVDKALDDSCDVIRNLKQQLAEKEKLLRKYAATSCPINNQTAIAVLEKVQKYIVEDAKPVIGYPYLKNSVMILNFVCDQIKSLKGDSQ